MSRHLAFNPYLPSFEYVPDGEPRVFGERLYVYGSHDRFGGKDFCMNDYVCWSAPLCDLGDWRCEGVIYYLYYQLHILTCTCVAVADTPAGPFEYYGCVQYPDGTPYGEKKGDTFAFDPGVLVDENGKVYLYVGFSPEGAFKLVLRLRGNRVEEAVCPELEPDMKTIRALISFPL